MAKSIMMKPPNTGILKKGLYGFSWTTFFFGGFPALFRGDIIIGLIVIVLNCLTFCVAGIIWAFVYNKKYTLGLVEKGYIFSDTEEKNKEAKCALGIAEPITETIMPSVETENPLKENEEIEEYNDDLFFDGNNNELWKEEWLEEITSYLGKEPSESEELSLRNRFGGDQECLYNFRMYASRVNRGRTLCYSPPSDHYHPRFEVLRRGDIANVCDTFEYDMLDFLKMYELRSIGTALGMPSVGRSMKEAKELLMKVSKEKLAEAWQTTGMDIQDFYRLDILKK